MATIRSDYFESTWCFERKGENWYLVKAMGRAEMYYGNNATRIIHVVPNDRAAHNTWDSLTRKILGRYVNGKPVKTWKPDLTL